MSDVAIRVKNLSKRYRIGQLEPYNTLRDSLTNTLSVPFRAIGLAHKKLPKAATPANNTIWALKDVSFEVKQGEAIGIIGRNGAGKTTLLKILTRITNPTEGYAEVNGRVGSLLEVGTGFHPELTGRENIYLNGAILGMKRAEVQGKFDEIVDFSGVEKFIDTPLKRYSSGMQVRLAFAVAAHLEPDILLVDEVLAVGDVEFQKKSLGKMEDAARGGRTVLFVSHNMGAITNLCSRALLIANGQIAADGPANTVVADYIGSVSDTTDSSYVCQEKPDSPAWIASADLKSANGQSCGTFLMSEPIIVECALNIIEKSKLTLSVQIKEMNNSPIYLFLNVDSPFVMPSSPGRHRIRVRIPPLNLYPGKYLLQLTLGRSGAHGALHVVESISFEVQQDYSLCSRAIGRHEGVIFAPVEWSVD